MHLTAHQAKTIDIRLREALGISTLVLMENAGAAVAQEVLRMLESKNKIAIFCGKGNNGGDGFVAARHLLARGLRPDIFLASKIREVRNEAKVNLDILLKLKQEVAEVNELTLARIRHKASSYHVIVDALLGVGLTGAVEGVYKDLTEIINASGTKVLAVDVPSGLDATTGKVLGSCVKADVTVTFIAKKKGMMIGCGPAVCGKMIVSDLGTPFESIGRVSFEIS